MKAIFGIILLCMAIIGCTQAPEVEEAKGGRVVFAVTDAAADMGSVTSVKMTIDGVSTHNSLEGWTTVSTTPKTVDLLQLQAEGSNALLADVTLKEGTYNQIRLNISQIIVVDDEGAHEAKLPSGELKFVGNVDVKQNSTSVAIFDFIVNESLHITGKGEYIMAPVVQVEVREDADVAISSNKVEVKSGMLKVSSRIGMDEKGNVGAGLRIESGASVEIDAGVIKVNSKSSASSNNSKTSANSTASGSIGIANTSISGNAVVMI